MVKLCEKTEADQNNATAITKNAFALIARSLPRYVGSIGSEAQTQNGLVQIFARKTGDT
jgi:hypothetical protein